MIKGLLFDLSGTIHIGDRLLPGVNETLLELGRKGLPMRFVTNTSRQTRNMLLERLKRLGLGIVGEHLFTAPQAVHDFLCEQRLRPLLLIHPELAPEFSDLPQENPDAVVLGDAADAFCYASLNRAFRLLLEGAPLLAVGDNRFFREPDGLSLDAGPFVKALEYAAGCKAILLGKPAPGFFLAAVDSLGLAADEVLMIGDDVETDINGASRAGLRAVLVRSGKYRAGDEARLADPGTPVCDDLCGIVRLLQASGPLRATCL